VPSLRDSFNVATSTRHLRAGLSHAAPSGLESEDSIPPLAPKFSSHAHSESPHLFVLTRRWSAALPRYCRRPLNQFSGRISPIAQTHSPSHTPLLSLPPRDTAG